MTEQQADDQRQRTLENLRRVFGIRDRLADLQRRILLPWDQAQYAQRILERANAPWGRLDRMQQMLDQLGTPWEQVDRTQRILGQVGGPRFSNQFEGVLERLGFNADLGARIDRLLKSYDIGAALGNVTETVERALRQSLPANWRDLSLDEADFAQELVVEHGLPIVWVPAPALTAQMIQTEDRHEALNILMVHQGAVLDYIHEVLDAVNDDELRLHVEQARRAVTTARKEEPQAAQALAAAVMTAGLSDGLGLDKHGAIRDFADEHHPEQADLRSYRTCLVLHLAGRYVRGKDYALPGFNRSTSLHTVDPKQYTPENSLMSLMAMAMLLREAHEVRREART